jgi:hypothetical protein
MRRYRTFFALLILLTVQPSAHAADSLKKFEIEGKIAKYKAAGDYERALELLNLYIDMRERQAHPLDFILAAALRERAALQSC